MAGGRQRPALPSRVEEGLSPGEVVTVPKQAWRGLLLGFGPEVVERLVSQAMGERTGRDESAGDVC